MGVVSPYNHLLNIYLTLQKYKRFLTKLSPPAERNGSLTHGQRRPILERAKWKLPTQIQLPIHLPSTVKIRLSACRLSVEKNRPGETPFGVSGSLAASDKRNRSSSRTGTPDGRSTSSIRADEYRRTNTRSARHSQVQTRKGLTSFTAHKKIAWAASTQIAKKHHRNLTKAIRRELTEELDANFLLNGD